ncbi:MAG: cupredoxin domain-containing protein [Actinomycetota bacterium]
MKRLLPALGLILLAGCGLADASAEVRTITIDIEHSAFVPSEVNVRAGERVRFIVRNNDPIDHEFIIGNDHIQLIHEEGTERHHGARDGEVSIPAQAERVTSYTFDEPGRLIYGCHLPQHYDYGMKGDITVS